MQSRNLRANRQRTGPGTISPLGFGWSWPWPLAPEVGIWPSPGQWVFSTLWTILISSTIRTWPKLIQWDWTLEILGNGRLLSGRVARLTEYKRGVANDWLVTIEKIMAWNEARVKESRTMRMEKDYQQPCLKTWIQPSLCLDLSVMWASNVLPSCVCVCVFLSLATKWLLTHSKPQRELGY